MIRESIWSALARKLGREPTNSEIKEECKRIMAEAIQDMASKGKLAYQRGKRT